MQSVFQLKLTSLLFCEERLSDATTGDEIIVIFVERSNTSEQLYLDYDVNGSVTRYAITLGKRKMMLILCYLPSAYSKYKYNRHYLTKRSDNT